MLYDVNTPLADVMEHSADWTKVYQDGLERRVRADRQGRVAAPARRSRTRTRRKRLRAAVAKAAAECGAQNQ